MWLVYVGQSCKDNHVCFWNRCRKGINNYNLSSFFNKKTRACHHLTLGWTFSYLLFFRTVTYFNYPEPTPFTNAVQLLLTLKVSGYFWDIEKEGCLAWRGSKVLFSGIFVSQLLSLANEVQELIQAKKQEVTTFTKSPVIGTVLQKPGLVEILCYSYCYVGLMTGKVN